RDLDRLGADLEKAIDLARDPREAARQLARLQESLKQRVAEEAKRKDTRVPLRERLKELQPQQEAIHRAAKGLEVPANNREAPNDQRRAADRAAAAARGLQQQRPEWVRNQMEQARQALEQLANRLPSLEQRKQQALQQIADLRRQQDDIARQAEQAVKRL